MLHGEKSGLTLELSQRGGGWGGQSKVKWALFATDRFPLGSPSSYLTPMVVLLFPYLINVLGDIYIFFFNNKCWYEKYSQVVQSRGGGGLGSFRKVPKLVSFFWCSIPKGKVKKTHKTSGLCLNRGGGGSENYPLCLNPIFDFLNMTFKHKLYINMVTFLILFSLQRSVLVY